jgi:hypothetical protein
MQVVMFILPRPDVHPPLCTHSHTPHTIQQLGFIRPNVLERTVDTCETPLRSTQ